MNISTKDLIDALRRCSTPGGGKCEGCPFDNNSNFEEPWCGDTLCQASADRMEELVDRCARYAEEIAQLRSTLEEVLTNDAAPT